MCATTHPSPICTRVALFDTTFARIGERTRTSLLRTTRESTMGPSISWGYAVVRRSLTRIIHEARFDTARAPACRRCSSSK